MLPRRTSWVRRGANHGMTHRLLDDPFVAARIEAALSPYAKRLSAEELGWMRERLAELLAGDPEARDLLNQAHPRGPIDTSGEQLRPGLDAPADDAEDSREEAG